ncbi:hypothetical protein F5Y18DRAFT_425823 [Xylariaceae sp. FL1019]|nr:hypothetical protein F5Y18DRAFT_425823 [Xylariaceae sp. FL1019]
MYRSPSTASSRSAMSPRSGSILRKATTFICRHSTDSRLNTVFTQLNLPAKSRKCFECQTDAPESVFKLIDTMIASPELDSIDSNIVRQATQLLFERLTVQRRKTNTGFKEQWRQVLLLYATFCYRRVPVSDLSRVCQNLKLRYGAGVDRELLRALVEAAASQNGVWDLVEPASSPLYSSINAFVSKARGKAGSVETFAQVQAMFKAVELLGKLSEQTFSVLSEVNVELARIPT